MLRAITGGGGERRRGWTRGVTVGVKIVDEDENGRVTVSSTRTGARVTLDHALGGEESLNLLSQFSHAIVLLEATRISKVWRKRK